MDEITGGHTECEIGFIYTALGYPSDRCLKLFRFRKGNYSNDLKAELFPLSCEVVWLMLVRALILPLYVETWCLQGVQRAQHTQQLCHCNKPRGLCQHSISATVSQRRHGITHNEPDLQPTYVPFTPWSSAKVTIRLTQLWGERGYRRSAKIILNPSQALRWVHLSWTNMHIDRIDTVWRLTLVYWWKVWRTHTNILLDALGNLATSKLKICTS